MEQQSGAPCLMQTDRPARKFNQFRTRHFASLRVATPWLREAWRGAAPRYVPICQDNNSCSTASALHCLALPARSSCQGGSQAGGARRAVFIVCFIARTLLPHLQQQSALEVAHGLREISRPLPHHSESGVYCTPPVAAARLSSPRLAPPLHRRQAVRRRNAE